LLFDGAVSRVDFEPATHPGGIYRLLNTVVVPRPIAWVSTRSADGVDNLAPHSFFTVSCADPPIVQFTSIGRKDSLANAVAGGEFVVNLAPEHLFEEVNASATDFPPDRDEFAEVGLEREPSALVAPPRVAESPVAIECVLHDTKDLGTSVVVFGRVVLLSVASGAIVDGYPAIERLRPLARLGRRQWSTIGEVREIGRVKFKDWNARPGR
jgi:flavin reductase (DIM6/NTAB) family NADH-FMN oxidoreductase RutF